MKLTLLACAALVSGAIVAQKPQADKFETSKGALTVQPVYHGALVLQFNGKNIYVDPYHAKSYDKNTRPDLVLITDIHPDHLDSATLADIGARDAKFIVPRAVADKMPEAYRRNAAVLANGESTEWEGIKISAIPMYNLPEDASSMHSKGRGNGYVLDIGGKRVYISGDTEDIPEMRSLKNIDIAFVCMNLPYTMDVKQAADAVLAFHPKVVYPYHYRGKDGLSDTGEFKKLVEKGGSGIDVRLRNWYGE